ncbi:MAG: hypothetical protein ACLT76_10035 [Clostridium fessum]
MIQSLLRAMELLELLKEANHKYSIAELSESIRASAQHNPPDFADIL